MSITVAQMPRPDKHEVRHAIACLEVINALLEMPDASYRFQANDRQGVLRGMTLSRPVVEMLGSVLRELASGYGVQLQSFSEAISVAQADRLLNDLAPGFRIP